MFSERPTTSEIQDVFANEIAVAGGTVSDVFDDGRRLFARSILPWVREVRTRDQLQGGVALRVTDEECSVHPYVFRQVCRNGAIMAQSLESRCLEDWGQAPEDAVETLREAISQCCRQEVFLTAVDQLRAAAHNEIDMALTVLPFIQRMPAGMQSKILSDIMQRFFRDSDRTAFGLMNAVTATARDTRDPELRWRLEELGGGIPALIGPQGEPDDSRLSVELAL